MALVAGLLVYWVLGGFAPDADRNPTGPVRVAAPPESSRADEICAKLLGGLPRELAGQRPRPVSSAPHRVVAWGSPPIVLRCGVTKPAALTPTAQLLGIEGVEWVYAQDGRTGVWTTTSLALYVEVRVPEKYGEKASTAIINPLAAPLKGNVPPAP